MYADVRSLTTSSLPDLALAGHIQASVRIRTRVQRARMWVGGWVGGWVPVLGAWGEWCGGLVLLLILKITQSLVGSFHPS